MDPFIIGAIVIVAFIAILLLVMLSKKGKKQLPKKETESQSSLSQTAESVSSTGIPKKDSKSDIKVTDADKTIGHADQKEPPIQKISGTELKKETIPLETSESTSVPGTKDDEDEIISSKSFDISVEPIPGVELDEEAETKAVAELEKERRERKLKKLRQGLAPTRSGLFSRIGELFKSKKEIDPSLLDELEEVLLTSDVGSKTTDKLLSSIRSALDSDELSDPEAVWGLLKEAVKEILKVDATPIDTTRDKPFVIMVVGVNGVGKTTTIGKLATTFSENGQKVVLAAADTFRAAAVNQLSIWGRRANAEVIKSKEGADPSSVVFDAIKKAKEIGADIVIADTAGRLHTQQPLMEELRKIHRVVGKAHENAPHEVLLVLDATTGQNAIQQVSMFKDTLEITGLVLTKLDGTAKGGVIIGICNEHAIPVRYIGIGEARDDLRDFDVSDFVDALFYKESH